MDTNGLSHGLSLLSVARACIWGAVVASSVRSASSPPFSLSGRRIRSEGQRGGRPWPPRLGWSSARSDHVATVIRRICPVSSAAARASRDHMTHLCCPRCRLRFTPASAAYLVSCPDCGQPPKQLPLVDTVGFRVFRLDDVPHAMPEAVAISIPVTRPGGARS